MRLVSLRLRNFLTYDDFHYTFENRPLLIQGENRTETTQASNGSGKSGMLTGIEYCIAATNSRGVRDEEIIRFGYDVAEADLIAACDVRKQFIKIEWLIKKKGANKVAISHQAYGSEEWQEVVFSNVADGKKYIMNWFALSKEDLFNYFIINKTRFKSFYDSSNKENVDLINRFSDASIINGLEDIDIADLENSYELLRGEILKIEGKVELLQESLERERSRDLKSELIEAQEELEDELDELEDSIDDHRKAIKELPNKQLEYESKISELKDEIRGCELDIESQKESKAHYEEEISKFDSSINKAKEAIQKFIRTNFKAERDELYESIDESEEEIEEFEESLDELETKDRKLKVLIGKLTTELSGSATCPSCNYEFLLTGDIEEVRSKKVNAEKLQVVLDKRVESIKLDIKAVKDFSKETSKKLAEINKKEEIENQDFSKLEKALTDIENQVRSIERSKDRVDRRISDLESDIQRTNLKIAGFKDKITNLENEKTNLESQIDLVESKKEVVRNKISSLKPEDNSEAIKTLEKDIDDLQSLKRIKTEEFEELTGEIYELKQWINNFKQFRMFLANQSLETIEYHNNRFLKEMNSDLVLKLEGFRVLASGNIKEEITAKIIRNQERTYNSFSAGERGRLLFASILANRYMINSTHPYGGLDFLGIDEIFEGIDGLGLKYLMRSINKLDFTIFVVTHVTDEYTSQDVLKIVKENGVSRIENNN